MADNQTKALDWIRRNAPKFTPEAKANGTSRLLTCKECPKFSNATTLCKQCGCIMPIKVFFPTAKCPLGRWAQ